MTTPVLTLPFLNKNEFQILWKHKFSKGTFLLDHDCSFPVQTEIQLRILLKDSQATLRLPARVIQILEGNSSDSNGMVIELIGLQNIQEQISQLIESSEGKDWKVERDFSRNDGPSPHLSPPLKILFEKAQKIIKGIENHRLNQMLQLKEKATSKEIRDVYLKLYQEFNPHLYLGKFSEKKVEIFETARRKLKQLHDEFQAKMNQEEKERSPKPILKKKSKKKIKGTPALSFKKVKEARVKEKMLKDKAKRLFEDALVSEGKGEIHEAVTNIRLAIMHDPLNSTYKRKLAELETIDKRQNRERNRFKSQGLERAQVKDKKLDWIDD